MIEQALTLTDTVTLRKRKLPLESMVWLVIGMAVFNQRPLSHIVNLMDIADRSGTPLKKNTQYEVISKLGRQDRLVRIKTSPQARKQWATLPESITARLLTKTIEGKTREVLTSLTDPMRYPAAEVNALYAHRWEIELGYREAKQGLLGNRWHLRSRLPEMVRQELWGVLLTYNLVRYQMVKMAFTLKGDYLPYQLSFSGSFFIALFCRGWLCGQTA